MLFERLLEFRRTRRLAEIKRANGGGDRILYTLPCGRRLQLRFSDIVARRLLLWGKFEPEVSTAIFALVRPGMTVLDIGANIGLHTVDLAGRVGPRGRVIAFEPNPAVRAELNANVLLNGLKNVEVREEALWDRDGDETFCFPAIGSEAMGGLRRNQTFDVKYEAKVTAARLDTTLSLLGINEVDFIKLDVEGAELPVLRGAGTLLDGSNRPSVLFESHLANSAPYSYTPKDLVDFLVAKRFSVEKIDAADYLALPVMT
jgi:FkbM family methyltransferase